MTAFAALRHIAAERIARAGRRADKSAYKVPHPRAPATPRVREAALDFRAVPHDAVRPAGFKSYFAHEAAGWSATIKVDYDWGINAPTYAACQTARTWLKKRGIRPTAVRAYATRKGLHLRVWAVDGAGHPPSAVEIWTVQNLLHDDPWRVTFNLRRVEKGVIGWNVLFTEKWKDGVLVSWETFDPAWTEKFARWLGVAKTEAPKTRARSHRSE